MTHRHWTPQKRLRGDPEGWERVPAAEVFYHPETGRVAITGIPMTADGLALCFTRPIDPVEVDSPVASPLGTHLRETLERIRGGTIQIPTDRLRELADEALKALEERRDQDVDGWAKRLAEDVARGDGPDLPKPDAWEVKKFPDPLALGEWAPMPTRDLAVTLANRYGTGLIRGVTYHPEERVGEEGEDE